MPASTLSPRLRLARKIALITGGVIAAVAVVAVAGIYGVSAWELNARHAVVGPALRVTPAPLMVVEGERLAHVNGCFGCHGDNLAGRVFIDRLFVGRLSGHNLTRVVPQYTDDQLEHAMRGGVKSDGTGLVFMPSHALVRLADADVAAIIAYLRTVERHPDAAKDTSLGLLARALLVTGMISLEPDNVDRNQLGPRARPTEAGALGRYLAGSTCAICHGGDLHGDKEMQSPNLFGIVHAYSLAQFKALLSTGIGIGGRKLGLMTEMSQSGLKYLHDDEVAALHAYLSAPEATAQRSR
ncbi:MAG TPA: c-type cytochrome [Steroidobacteraceae bacterium]